MKLINKKDSIYSVVYLIWFLSICLIFHNNNNLNYGFIAAWCSSLWISSIFKIRLKSVILSFVLLLITFLIDGFGNFFIFTSPKQTEDLILLIFAAIGILPILINHYVHIILDRYLNGSSL